MMRFPFRFYPFLLGALFFLVSDLAVADQSWPRKIANRQGEIVIERQPSRIVSTSVTLTGSLLAIDAPVIASGATMPGHRLADQQGFFRQWSDIARSRRVKRLYTGEPSLEAIAAEKPDLILVSATGNDSALAIVDRLSALAPTLVVNYDDKSWQQIERILAQATGREAQAEHLITAFAEREKEIKKKLVLPPQPVSALVFNPHSRIANLWTGESAQGQLLESLGFTLAMPPENLLSAQRIRRKDILSLSGENLVTGIRGHSILLFATDESGKQAVMAEPLLAGTSAVRNQQVYALGNETFRLDFYSANQLLTRLEQLFGRR